MRNLLVLGPFLMLLMSNVIAQQKPMQVDSSAMPANIRREYYQALFYKNLGKTADAYALFENIIKQRPDCSPALYELAAISLASQKDNQAEEYIVRALQNEHSNKWYWLVYVEAQKRKKQPGLLLGAFNKLIELDPDNDAFYYDKAIALQMLGRNKDADSVYVQIEKRFGSSPVLLDARRGLAAADSTEDQRMVQLEQLCRQKPSKLDYYLTLADLYLRNKRPDDAFRILKKGKRVFGNNYYLHLLFSDYYRFQGDSSQSLKETKAAFANKEMSIDVKVKIILANFQQIKDPRVLAELLALGAVVIKTHPEEAKAFALYGDLLVQANRIPEAVSCYHRAVDLNDSIQLVWAQLLQLEAYLGQIEPLLKDAKRAIAVFPEQSDFYYFASIALSSKGEHESSIEYLRRALELKPSGNISVAEIYASLASSLHSLKRYAESDSSFEASLKLDPNNVFVLNNFAYYLSLRKEKLDLAEGMASRANELKPDMASFEDTYAWVLFCNGKYPEARIWIEKALKNNKSSAIQYEHYGDILFRLGEKAMALEQWIKAREKGIKSELLDKKIDERNYFE